MFRRLDGKGLENGSSSVDWAELNRPLPEDGDGVQSPKCFEIRKAGQSIMSRKVNNCVKKMFENFNQ
jgi:hypothetical protein